jgi:DNA ligase-1
MLAAVVPDDLSELVYPVLASPKLDGIRCLIDAHGLPVSRSLKPIRNRTIHTALAGSAPGLDGELIVGDPAASDVMRVTNSGVMSLDKDPGDWTFWVFDLWTRQASYRSVYEQLSGIIQARYPDSRIKWLPHFICYDAKELERYEQHWLDEGFEGAMVRNPDKAYKFGRSTVREQGLLKMKRFIQEEAVVVSAEPLYHNDNEATTNALGYTERTSHKEGKIALDTLGALVCKGANPYNKLEEITFNIGTGFTAAERSLIWTQRDKLPGRFVTYKFFPTGSKSRPRHPVFVSFRDEEDME